MARSSRLSVCLAIAMRNSSKIHCARSIIDRARGLRVMARPCGEFAIAHGAQLPAERLLGNRDAELLEDPLCQIDQPPTHHAVDCRNRPTLDHAGDGLALDVVELGRLPRRLSVQQTVRAPLAEVQHPISDDLKPHTANHRRLSTRRAVIDRCKSQKPTGLGAVFRLFAKPRSWDAPKSR